jgi:hypothetical protein
MVGEHPVVNVPTIGYSSGLKDKEKNASLCAFNKQQGKVKQL